MVKDIDSFFSPLLGLTWVLGFGFRGASVEELGFNVSLFSVLLF